MPPKRFLTSRSEDSWFLAVRLWMSNFAYWFKRPMSLLIVVMYVSRFDSLIRMGFVVTFVSKCWLSLMMYLTLPTSIMYWSDQIITFFVAAVVNKDGNRHKY